MSTHSRTHALTHSRTHAWCILAACLVVSLCCGRSIAQVSLPPLGRVIQVWVDPHYGDDAQARNLNPKSGAQSGQPNLRMPVDWVHPSTNDCLYHYPWPFYTIKAAIDFIVDESTKTSGSPLPYTSNDGKYIFEHAIIHLLPGRYGPQTSGSNTMPTPSYYNHNGVHSNGEVLPICIPPNFTLKGTSALNTYLDAHAAGGSSIVQFGELVNFGTVVGKQRNIACTGENTTIDRVAILGAMDGTQPYNTSGILLTRSRKCVPTITNCMILYNAYGIFVDASRSDQVPFVSHEPIIVNNTFAGNCLGIWNGQYDPLEPNSCGVSRLTLVNNVFDSAQEPAFVGNNPVPFGVINANLCSDFEGVDADDLTVTSVMPARDFNAYSSGRYNRMTTLALLNGLFGNKVTLARNASPAMPGIDVRDYVRKGNEISGRRGTLFVRDLIYAGQQVSPPIFKPATEFDGSAHDFRLSPAVATNESAYAPPTILNPLVDAGLSDLPFTMANGRLFTVPPGWIATQEQQWIFHSWSSDCEGFGNPRESDHPSYNPSNPYGKIDIGADELGQLLVTGYRFGTTRFHSRAAETMDPPGPITVEMDNKYVWFIGVPDSLAGGGPDLQARPRYVDLATAPDTTWQSNWAFARPAATGYRHVGSQSYPTVADVTPHLLPDVHPWWSIVNPIYHPSNPFWRYFDAIEGPIVNGNLYVYPISPDPNPGGAGTGNQKFVWLDALLHPTTYEGKPWLFLGSAPPSVAGQSLTVNYDSWCRGTHGANAYAPLKPTGATQASRYSIEYSDAEPRPNLSKKNMQTCLVNVK